jgi:hypothetical protein
MTNTRIYLITLGTRNQLEGIYKEILELGESKGVGTFFLLEHLQKAIDEANELACNYQDIINSKQ